MVFIVAQAVETAFSPTNRHSRKCKYFYTELIEKAYKIKENVNHVVHPTSAKKPDLQMPGLDIIKDTFYILEMLFR